MSETERLIELVKERRFLYDYKDPDYKNRAKRTQAWQEIASEMGTGSPEIWTSKWKGLKDNYGKHKKTMDHAYADTYKKYKNWPWSEHVSFLDDCSLTISKKAYNNLIKSRGRDEAQETMKQRGIQLFIPDTNFSNLDSAIEDLNDPEPEVVQETRKRKLPSPDQPVADLENYIQKSRSNKPPLDGVDHFFLSYAQSFKKLPTRMQIMLKLEIATLFHRYELQAEGDTQESENKPRIIPLPVKYEYDFTNDD